MSNKFPIVLDTMEGQASGAPSLPAASASEQSEMALDSASATPILTTVPPELHVHLFKFLDPVTATCLALTCKKIYEVYQAVDLADDVEKPVSLHKKVPCKRRFLLPDDPAIIRLGDLLCVWAGKDRKLVYWPRGDKWVSAEKGQQLKEQGQFYDRARVVGCIRGSKFGIRP